MVLKGFGGIWRDLEAIDGGFGVGVGLGEKTTFLGDLWGILVACGCRLSVVEGGRGVRG